MHNSSLFNEVWINDNNLNDSIQATESQCSFSIFQHDSAVQNNLDDSIKSRTFLIPKIFHELARTHINGIHSSTSRSPDAPAAFSPLSPHSIPSHLATFVQPQLPVAAYSPTPSLPQLLPPSAVTAAVSANSRCRQYNPCHYRRWQCPHRRPHHLHSGCSRSRCLRPHQINQCAPAK